MKENTTSKKNNTVVLNAVQCIIFYLLKEFWELDGNRHVELSMNAIKELIDNHLNPSGFNMSFQYVRDNMNTLVDEKLVKRIKPGPRSGRSAVDMHTLGWDVVASAEVLLSRKHNDAKSVYAPLLPPGIKKEAKKGKPKTVVQLNTAQYVVFDYLKGFWKSTENEHATPATEQIVKMLMGYFHGKGFTLSSNTAYGIINSLLKFNVLSRQQIPKERGGHDLSLFSFNWDFLENAEVVLVRSRGNGQADYNGMLPLELQTENDSPDKSGPPDFVGPPRPPIVFLNLLIHLRKIVVNRPWGPQKTKEEIIEDTENPFRILVSKSCELHKNEFAGSASKSILNLIFFDEFHYIKVDFSEDGIFITPMGELECRLDENEILEGEKYKLPDDKPCVLRIGTIEYVAKIAMLAK